VWASLFRCWVIGGPRGAAIKLDLKRIPLSHKMQKLGQNSAFVGQAESERRTNCFGSLLESFRSYPSHCGLATVPSNWWVVL
jgi:hypothetical protein